MHRRADRRVDEGVRVRDLPRAPVERPGGHDDARRERARDACEVEPQVRGRRGLRLLRRGHVEPGRGQRDDEVLVGRRVRWVLLHALLLQLLVVVVVVLLLLPWIVDVRAVGGGG